MQYLKERWQKKADDPSTHAAMQLPQGKQGDKRVSRDQWMDGPNKHRYLHSLKHLLYLKTKITIIRMRNAIIIYVKQIR